MVEKNAAYPQEAAFQLVPGGIERIVVIQARNHRIAMPRMPQPDRQLPLLADLVANQRASSSATDGSQCAAENGVTGYPANHSARAGSDLRIGWAGAATAQGHQANNSGRNQEFCFHDGHLHNLSFR